MGVSVGLCSGPNIMTEIPRRLSLVSQVVEILRRDLQRGEWVEESGARSLRRTEIGERTRPRVRKSAPALIFSEGRGPLLGGAPNRTSRLERDRRLPPP